LGIEFSEMSVAVENIAVDLARRAVEVPNRVGVVYEDGRSLTFAEWEGAARSFAGVLDDIGVTRGDRVALYLQNSLELATALFGCWKIGAVPVTLSVMYNADELAASIDKTTPVALFTHGAKVDVVSDVRAKCSATAWIDRVVAMAEPDGAIAGVPDWVRPFATLVAGSTPFDDIVAPTEDDEGTILFTGGTTGMPKAVTVTHAGTRNSLRTLARVSKKGVEGPYDAVPDDVSPNLLALPLFHSGGQQALLFALHVGRSIVVMERFRVPTLERLVGEYAIDNLFLMPTMLYDIVHAKDRVALDAVRSVLIAGQALDPTLKQDFESGWRIPIFSNYGSTEIGHVAGWTSADLKAGRWTPGPVGRIYDGVDIEIRDESGATVAPGESGEIWVKNGNTKGYVDGATTATESLIVDGWVASSDVGYVDGDRLLYLVGRKRDMIKTGGFQVWPQEIEQVLRRHGAVADVAVVGVDDPRMGEIPKAFIVLADDAPADRDALSEVIVAYCKDKLAHFKCIREIEYIDELPRSEAGKVQRGELSSRARATK
jgi:long-chain acyl-CoA synthetase